jgi:hypothetical protein
MNSHPFAKLSPAEGWRRIFAAKICQRPVLAEKKHKGLLPPEVRRQEQLGWAEFFLGRYPGPPSS